MPSQIAAAARRARGNITLITSLLIVGLSVSIMSTTVLAQMTPLVDRGVDRGTDREPQPETPITLVAKIKRAHVQGITNAQALATYVTRNGTNLSQATVRAHCDAIGRSLDDALHFSAKLAEQLQSNDARKRVSLISKHDTHAKQTYRTLLDRLRGSSVTAPEIRMMAVQIQQDITAAERALTQIPIIDSADAGARPMASRGL